MQLRERRQNATTFTVPDVSELLKQVKDQAIYFKSRVEVEKVLLAQMNKLHSDYMMRMYDSFQAEGQNVSELTESAAVYRFSTGKIAIYCNVSRCGYRLELDERPDIGMTLGCRLKEKKHSFPYH